MKTEQLLIDYYKSNFLELTNRKLVCYIDETIPRIPLPKLLQYISEFFELANPLERCRRIEYLKARGVMFLIARNMGYFYKELGMFTGMDHSSILHAVKSKQCSYPDWIEALKEFKEYLRAKIEQENIT